MAERSPVRPHSAVFAPAGPTGAHGFRNTGRVPLAILFAYPSPGGKAPALRFLRPDRIRRAPLAGSGRMASPAARVGAKGILACGI